MCLLNPILPSLHLEPEMVSVRNFPMGLGYFNTPGGGSVAGAGMERSGGGGGRYVVNLTGESTSLEDRL